MSQNDLVLSHSAGDRLHIRAIFRKERIVNVFARALIKTYAPFRSFLLFNRKFLSFFFCLSSFLFFRMHPCVTMRRFFYPFLCVFPFNFLAINQVKKIRLKNTDERILNCYLLNSRKSGYLKILGS